ncbi:hypothetical protein IWQ56_004142, partial [Coemansia nantahalensis]
DIWDRFADFEYSYGDLSAISKLDKRIIEKFKHESVLTRMASRYSYLDADYVGVAEFGIPHRPEMQPDALAGAGGYRSHPASARDERRRAANAGAGDRRRAGSTAAGGLPNIAVASITGRYLNKSQLLATVTPNRFTRPAVGQMKEYKPVVDHAHRPGAPRRAPGDAGPHPAAALPPPPPPPPAAAAAPMPAPQQLLDHGDVLSYVAASVAAPNTSAFDSVALNSDALLGTIMQLSTLGPAAQSNYRPLSYMPWLSRADHGPQQAHGGGFHRSDHGGRPLVLSDARRRERSSGVFTCADGVTVPAVIVDQKGRGQEYRVGAFGRCYEVEVLGHAMPSNWACKMLEKSSFKSRKIVERVRYEMKVMKQLPQHRNVVGFYHLFEDTERLYIMMEQCTRRTLHDLLLRRKRLTEFEARYFTAQLADGISALHRARIIHRDIKHSNLLLDGMNRIKIADFGLSTIVGESGDRKKSFLGTPNFLAPEL